MRIAVGGFMHETNTFVPSRTTWDDFRRGGPWPVVTEGDAILSTFGTVNLAIAHFMNVARQAGHVMVPLAWACALPAGHVTDDAFERMAGKLVEGARRARPDAVFLELHGAMVTESHDDGERELLRRMRERHRLRRADPDVARPARQRLARDASNWPTSSPPTAPIRMSIGAPQAHAARNGSIACVAWKRPARAFRQAPFLIPVTTGCTYVEPSKGLYEQLQAIEAETGVHLSLNMGFPPADIFDVGPSVTAYGEDQAKVDAAADRLFAAVLAAEADFAAHKPLPVADAVAEAMSIALNASRPVVLADTQDNPGAGAPSNTTGLIAELLRQRAERAAVGIVHDVRAAEAAHAAGVGGSIDRLGGGAEGPGQQPLPGPWRVVAVSDGRFKGTSPMLRTAETSMGKTALLAQDGVEVLVASIRQQPVHREAFTHLGVDLDACAIVGLKSSAHFRSGYQEIAEKVIVCLAPGVNIEDPASFRFTKVRPGVRLRPQMR